MSDDGRSRGDAAFAAFTRIETKIDFVIGILRGAGFLAIADMADARSQYGDVKIAMQMKAWPGQQYKGGRASDCPSAFLNAYADMLEGMALRTMAKPAERDDPEKLKYARFNLKDAALCRAWAIINKDKAGAEPEAGASAAGWEGESPPGARPTPRSNGNPETGGDTWGNNTSDSEW